jgi:hypothetical protein
MNEWIPGLFNKKAHKENTDAGHNRADKVNKYWFKAETGIPRNKIINQQCGQSKNAAMVVSRKAEI